MNFTREFSALYSNRDSVGQVFQTSSNPTVPGTRSLGSIIINVSCPIALRMASQLPLIALAQFDGSAADKNSKVAASKSFDFADSFALSKYLV